MSYRTLDLTTHTSLSPIWRWFTPGFVNYKKGCIRLAVDQLLAHGRWFTPGTPASSTTKTGHHDITESFCIKFTFRQTFKTLVVNV
jgi:hypothetical protein